MIILGLSPVAHNSAVGLLIDGKLVAAAAEERFTRVKNQGGFPHRALCFVLDHAGIRPSDVDWVAYAALPFAVERQRDLEGLAHNVAYVSQANAPRLQRLSHLANYAKNVVRMTELPAWGRSQRGIVKSLAEYGLSDRVVYIDHHRAHCASAYYMSGFDRALVVSLDGYGSGQAGAFYLGEGDRLTKLTSVPYPHSLGTYYRRVTQALGFKPNQHEGKIVGLAAFGDASRLRHTVLSRFDLSHPDYFRLPAGQDPYFERDLAAKYPRQDVAAAYQSVLEEVVTEYVGTWLRRTGATRVALAGGVFANVKLNQRVATLPGVEEIFVFPAMGDDGVGVGAAIALQADLQRLEPRRLHDVFLGPSFSEADMERALRHAKVPFSRHENVEEVIAEHLASERVVARVDGRMEFGPRALGNRSLLYPATKPEVNQWLNERLNRTEFMPFAPVTLEDEATHLYGSADVMRYAWEFMTVTTDCSATMKRQSPAAVHVDGTARPQLVTKASNPSLFRVLSAYRNRTGLGTVINTSFNMHEEPIVCSPADAVRAFNQGALEVLAMGPFVAQLPADRAQRSD